MRLTSSDLQKTYRWYNKTYFDNKLPKDMIVKFVDSSEVDGDYGTYIDGEILIRDDLRNVADFAYIVLLHEMAHAKVPNNSHGFQFGAVITSLWQKGAYDDLV